jgi:multifunctional beta-oxidation protein
VGLIGLTRTLAREGTKYNIKTNVIVPVSYRDIPGLNRADGQLAATAMLATAMPPDMLKGLRPEFIAPFVGILTAKNVSLLRPIKLMNRDLMSTVESLSLQVDTIPS